jgi:hypothetical protein
MSVAAGGGGGDSIGMMRATNLFFLHPGSQLGYDDAGSFSRLHSLNASTSSGARCTLALSSSSFSPPSLSSSSSSSPSPRCLIDDDVNADNDK